MKDNCVIDTCQCWAQAAQLSGNRNFIVISSLKF